MTQTHIKRRQPAEPGSIPDKLQMFSREVRFYSEITDVGVRIPALVRAEVAEDGSTLLEIEDLSSWREGADPIAAAEALAQLHRRWEGRAETEWPWLPRADVSDLVEAYFASRWPRIQERSDFPSDLKHLGELLVGQIAAVSAAASGVGPHTLTHGDASARNMRTSDDGQVALLDWEDVGTGPGISDVAWFLVSSAPPDRWDEALLAYGSSSGFVQTLPVVCAQGLLSLDDLEDGSAAAATWIRNLHAAAARL